MRKVGPLSMDLVVACKIHELQNPDGKGVEFMQLVDGLEGIVSRSTVLNVLSTLSDWGIVKTEFGETSSGRAGRLFFVSGEAEAMIKETYDRFWDKVLEDVEHTRS